MSDVKRCKQCGLLKDVDEFRPYTYSKQNETGGRFSICRSCESMNTKYARLRQTAEQGFPFKPDESSNAAYEARETFHKVKSEIQAFEDLFKLLESKGLHTPLSRKPVEDRQSDMDVNIGKLLEFYQAETVRPVVVLPTVHKVVVPDELQQWLDDDPDTWIQKGLSPEFLQETIYESLKAKYRPQIGVDKTTYMPLYDDTYKDALNNILRKFDNYEEQMAGEEVTE